MHENEIPHDPGIVERRRESKFFPIERTEVVLGGKEPIRLGMDRALGGGRVYGSRARQADGTRVCSWVPADAVLAVTMLAFGGQLEGDGRLVVARIEKWALSNGFGTLLDRLRLYLLVLFVDFENWIDEFLGSFQDWHPPRKFVGWSLQRSTLCSSI